MAAVPGKTERQPATLESLMTAVTHLVSRKPSCALQYLRHLGAALVLVLSVDVAAQAASQAAPGQRELTVDALSVVKVKSQAVRDARSSGTLGTEREGTGIVIDSNGLVLTIGYLITEAEKVELSTSDGKVFPATVIGYESTTGMGLVKALTPLPVKPVDIGESAVAAERELVLIVGFDG